MDKYTYFCGKTEKKPYFCGMNRTFYRILLLLMLLFTVPTLSWGQVFLWDVDFDFRFDNREYGDPSRLVAPSGTLFGANLRPEAGIGWGYDHALKIGTTIPADMGSESFMGDPQLIAYYSFDGKEFRPTLGLFPRNKLQGRYSYAFFSDSYRFYNSTIEGLMIQYCRPDWFVEVGCDWNGLRSKTRREMFTIFLAGEDRKGLSYAGYTAILHHHAASDTARGVVDNALGEIYMGIDLTPLLHDISLWCQIGYLQAYQNDRLHIGTPTLPNGYEIDLQMKRDDMGLRNTFYKGENLMPYWELPYEDAEGGIYGHHLYSGDPFYRVGDKGFYNRLELYWQPELKDGINLRISSVHHFDGHHWGWQQVIALSVDIGSAMFAPIR